MQSTIKSSITGLLLSVLAIGASGTEAQELPTKTKSKQLSSGSGSNKKSTSKTAKLSKKSPQKRAENACVKRGQDLYTIYQCSTCHILNGKGAEDGVPLDGIGSRHDRSFIKEQLIDPEEHVSKNKAAYHGDPSLMPKPDLSAQEITDLSYYLYSLKTSKEKKGKSN